MTAILRMVPGSELRPEVQKHALARFVHRYTRDHKPVWARKKRKNSSPYPVQFASDQEWLANTLFAVRKDGRLSELSHDATSSPTWPDNPELRR